MTVRRTIHCDVPGCGAELREARPGDGWKGWGQLQGVAVPLPEEQGLSSRPNPDLCPRHLAEAAAAVLGNKKEG